MNNKNLIEIKKYNEVNNSFTKRVVFHVGDGGGFYSEVDAMMQCMLWCYARKIKFVLYSDDANFSGGHGWNVFFESFCEEDHNILNHYGNHRFNIRLRDYKHYLQFKISSFILKKIYKIDYLTQDIFSIAIDRKVSQVEVVDCDIFDVHGVNFEEFAKLIKYVMRYNEKTLSEINKRIDSINIPNDYCSIQLRGGDKTLECDVLNNVSVMVERMISLKPDIKNLFVFTDDYSYIELIKNKYSQINVYTLTGENEKGYVNSDFQKSDWEYKYNNMIKLFSMVELCVNSSFHFGNECTCVNQYIKYSRKLENRPYEAVWFREDVNIKC